MTAPTATAPPPPPPEEPERPGPAAPSRLVPVAVLVLLAVPLIVGLVAVRSPTWYPVYDLAMTELRVRDVGTGDTPLIGLPGRIGTDDRQGSHPGPLSFYLLAPAYKLLGGSSYALLAANAILQLGAVAAALAVVWRGRRAGPTIGVGIIVAALLVGFGLQTLLEPWNPWLPRLWFLVLALAAWRVVEGDVRALAAVVLAGSLCAQTHAPYGAVTLAAGGLALTAAVVHSLRRRRAREMARGDWLWLAGSALLALFVWAPPLIDQAVREPGNLSILVDHFGSPEDDVNGWRAGVEHALRRLDLHHLLVQQWRHPGTLGDMLGAPPPRTGHGAAALVAWLAAAVASVRLRHRSLMSLHAVVAVTLAAAMFAMGRIFGPEWFYLMIWGWVVGALLAVATGWTAAAFISSRLPDPRRRRLGAAFAALGLLAIATLSGRLIVTAPDVALHGPDLNSQLAGLVPPTVEALRDRDSAPDDGRYIVSWADALHGGSGGYALVNELDRHGFRVGVDSGHAATIGPHRVIDPQQAQLRVHLATGGHIERWRNLPGAEVVAYHDPRTAEERREYERLRLRVADDLREVGMDHLLPALEDDLFGTAMNNQLPGLTALALGRMIELGTPAAVILLAPDLQP